MKNVILLPSNSNTIGCAQSKRRIPKVVKEAFEKNIQMKGRLGYGDKF
jgi:hypothetical protein